MLQLTSQFVGGYLDIAYNYSATQNNGRIVGLVDGGKDNVTAYTYDSLNRLTGASNTTGWSETYGYDGFGNLTSKTGSGGYPNPAPSVSLAYDGNNHLTSASYDANGNQTPPNATAAFSLENKMITLTSTIWPDGMNAWGYDPQGKRVMKESNPDPNN